MADNLFICIINPYTANQILLASTNNVSIFFKIHFMNNVQFFTQNNKVENPTITDFKITLIKYHFIDILI